MTTGPRAQSNAEAPRLTYADMEDFSYRLTDGGAVALDELRELAEHARWLYARRGSMIAALEALHLAGRLDLPDLVELYRCAEWDEGDASYVAMWRAHGPWPPAYWRAS